MHTATPWTLVAAASMVLAFSAGLGLAPSYRVSAPMQALTQVGCTPSGRAFARLELLFGTTKRDGGSVSETEWLAFLQNEITPRFPDGLTVLTGLGQWRTAQGQVTRETSRMLLIWHAPGPQTEAHVAAIRSLYRQRFDQDSVLRADSINCVTF